MNINKKPKQRRCAIRFSKLVFLGTSSAQPIPFKRNVSSMVLQFSSGNYAMIDCGEATQHQMKISTLKTGKLRHIFFTHLHGDHCYGIFGMLHSIRMPDEKQLILNIYGPRGVKQMIETTLNLSGGWNNFILNFHELHLDSTLSNIYTTKNVLDLGEIEPGIKVYACKISHRIETFGYVFIENDLQGKLDGAKARNLGAKGRQLGILKSGKNVELENGTIINAEEVLGPNIKGRKIAIMQDCSDCRSCFDVAQDCDLFIHECTYDEGTKEFAIPRGHSTAKMAALNAVKVNAKLLMLTHFSSRFVESNVDVEDIDINIEDNDEMKEDFHLDHVQRLQKEAEEVIEFNESDCLARCAADFMCVSMEEREKIIIEEKLAIVEKKRYHFKHDLKYLKNICGLQKKSKQDVSNDENVNHQSLKRKTSNISVDVESEEMSDRKRTKYFEPQSKQ